MDWKCAGWWLARYIPVGVLHIRNMSKVQCGVKAYLITLESLFFCHCVEPERVDASAERDGFGDSRALWARRTKGRESSVGRSIIV